MIGRVQLACNINASSVLWQDVAKASKVARVVVGATLAMSKVWSVRQHVV